MTSEQWLAKHGIDCAPLGARISAVQCDANKGHHYACETCPRGGIKFKGPRKFEKRRGRCEAEPIAAPPQPAEAATPARPTLPPLMRQNRVSGQSRCRAGRFARPCRPRSPRRSCSGCTK